jgi:hypothetical protein
LIFFVTKYHISGLGPKQTISYHLGRDVIETKRTIRQKPRDNFEEEEEEFKVEEPMAEQLVNKPPPARRPMKQSFVLQNLN